MDINEIGNWVMKGENGLQKVDENEKILSLRKRKKNKVMKKWVTRKWMKINIGIEWTGKNGLMEMFASENKVEGKRMEIKIQTLWKRKIIR